MAEVERPFTKIDDELLGRSDLSAGAKLLFSRLVRYQLGGINPSQARLAEKLGEHRTQIRRWLEELKARGLVVDDEAARGKRNRYALREAGTLCASFGKWARSVPGPDTERARLVGTHRVRKVGTPCATIETRRESLKDISEMAPAEKNETREAETPAGLVRLRERWSRRVASG